MIEDYFGSTFRSLNKKTENKLVKPKLQPNKKIQYGKTHQKNFLNNHKSNFKQLNTNNQKTQSISIYKTSSKFTRTQNSQDKLNRIQQLKRQEEKIEKLKNKYLRLEVQKVELQQTHKNQLKNYNQNAHQTQFKKNKKHLKTQNSKQKYYKNEKVSQKQLCIGPINSLIGNPINKSSSQQQQYYATNNYRQNDYTQTQNNKSQSYDANIKSSFHDQSVRSSQAYKLYLKNEAKHQNSKNYPLQIYDSVQRYNQRNSQSIQQDSRKFNKNNLTSGQESYYHNGQIVQDSNQEDQATVTKSVNKRYSSLSTNKKIKEKKILTYYQCEIKKMYNYNDEGYLTDNQINCRNKLQNGAREKFYQIISQTQSSKPIKSISQTNFKYLNRLKAQVDKQFGRQTINYQVNRLPSKTRQNINKSKQQKSEYPSELPPSSSLYKNKFKVQYIPQVFNQNILKKHEINDSFHQRQEKKTKQHQKTVIENAKSSIIKKMKQKKSQNNEHKQQKMSDEGYQQSGQSLTSQDKYSTQKQKDKINGISKIGGIFSDPNSYVYENRKTKYPQEQNLLQQLSKYSKQNDKIDKQFQKANNSEEQFDSQRSLNCSNVQQNKQNIINEIKKEKNSQYGVENIKDFEMINSKCIKQIKQQKISQKQLRSCLSQKQTELIRIQSKISQLNKVKQSQNQKKIKKQSNQNKIESNQLTKNSGLSQNIKQCIKNQFEITNLSKKQTEKQSQSKQSQINKKNIKYQNNAIKTKNNLGSYLQSITNQKQVNTKIQGNQISHNLQLNSNKKLTINSKFKLPIQSDKNLAICSNKNITITKNKQKRSKQSEIENSQNQFLSETNQRKLFQSEKNRIKQKDNKKSNSNFIAEVNQNKKINKLSKVQFQKDKSKFSSLMSHSNKTFNSELSSQSNNPTSQNNNSTLQNNNSTSQNNNSTSFNFLQKIHNLIDIQQDYHQTRKKQQLSQLSSQFQEILSKIQFHIYIVRFILDIAASAYHIYPQKQSVWVYKSCFLSFKKYVLQRQKISQALKGNKSCFKIAEYQLTEEDLKPYLQHGQIKILARDIDTCNKMTQQILQNYSIFLKNNYSAQLDETDINLRIFNDKNDLGILLKEYNLQIQGLKDKNTQQSMDQQQNSIINQRIFHLMQTGFLCSELSGKRIKQFQEELDEQQDFEQYFQQFWPLFQHILQTFS